MPPPETSHFGQGETEASSGKGSSPGSQCLSVGWSYGHTVQPDQAHTCLSGPCEATLSWHLCGSQPVCQELGTHISPVPSQRLHRRGITSSQQEGKRAKMSCWGDLRTFRSPSNGHYGQPGDGRLHSTSTLGPPSLQPPPRSPLICPAPQTLPAVFVPKPFCFRSVCWDPQFHTSQWRPPVEPGGLGLAVQLWPLGKFFALVLTRVNGMGS